MFFKNVANQYITVYAWDTANNAWKTGDAGNITAYISKDGGAAAQTNDANPTEISATNMKGAYRFSMTQAESNCESLELVAESSTANISIIPVSIYPTNFSSIWDEILTGATHNIATSSGKRLRQVSDPIVLDSGTAQAGSATTITLAVTANANDNFYKHTLVVISAGTGSGQSRLIESYVGATKVATIADDDNWIVNPDATSEYTIVPWGLVHAHSVNELDTQAKADVNAQVLDVMNVDTFADLSAGVPPSTPSMRLMMHYVFNEFVHKFIQEDPTASGNKFRTVYNQAGTAIYKKKVADDGTDYTETNAEAV
jgi:hypothetical protein